MNGIPKRLNWKQLKFKLEVWYQVGNACIFFFLKTRTFLFVVIFYFSQLKDGTSFHSQKIGTIFQSSDLVISFNKAISRRCFRVSTGRE